MSQFILDNLPIIEISPGYNAHIIHTNAISIFYVDITAGAVLPEHSHYNEQMLNVIQGDFELYVDGIKFNLSAGMSYYLKPNVKHSGKALTHCYIIDIFHPAREEFK